MHVVSSDRVFLDLWRLQCTVHYCVARGAGGAGGGPRGAGGGTDFRVVLHGRCSVARWQKFRPKSSKVAEFWLNLTKKVAEKGPHKIFKRSSLLLAMITTTYNVHQDEIKFDF